MSLLLLQTDLTCKSKTCYKGFIEEPVNILHDSWSKLTDHDEVILTFIS